ncbi:hypothetical protein [Mammaliicoccus lentus]|uniref:hypothetical protein n=1 Tax=Mammaliicoccus lentus TaxID=42858 RepID=UPI001C4F4C66|nr:hypothetical protein [Mammaliicoccus lentus]MBW0761378.1 hypothetical protein [Mammaliicoccus lentus]
MKDNKKLSQEDLLKIVWKDFYRLLDDINRTFNIIFNMFVSLIIITSLLVTILIVLILLLI